MTLLLSLFSSLRCSSLDGADRTSTIWSESSSRGQQVHEAHSQNVTSRSSALLSPLPGRAQPKDQPGSKKTPDPNNKWPTQAITLAPSTGSEKHTSCSASSAQLPAWGLGERKSMKGGPDSAWTAPPVGGQRRHSRRETLACGSGPSETKALSLSNTLDHSSWHLSDP